ncbi:50S ribosomal protein L6 [Candidatus Woesearchaeota archaeon]|jgi:large subunit ribosomal protein L6|nr:50S ribosomal protein L6 [Candidatus Woesearchaeota archaeon]MBT4835214.1 50S ribosomal protein L6 [Candidatus Woesearchaeota archaeon]MBT6734911.1 50S ribosomal protein L6 [Candidatus Woesearchaeota archaeon]MBT7169574.1 50S ribosomal protein L6 [Candidatus Woesearchaeota archaeon]MBT7474532.1 50S ribosomal protein L6 [Candidatus Woesearchaeota archaeon]
MVKVDIIDKISIPEGVEVSIDSNQINVKGPKGELSRGIFTPGIKIEVKENEVIFSIKKAAKKEKMVLKTTEAHLKNMINGVNEEYVYKLKICSGHFPMTVSLENQEVIVKNFLGESVPRKKKMQTGAEIEIKGNDITVTSIDIEKAGQVAASIEALTRITNKDRRRFQDGIFITSKAGKKI